MSISNLLNESCGLKLFCGGLEFTNINYPLYAMPMTGYADTGALAAVTFTDGVSAPFPGYLRCVSVGAISYIYFGINGPFTPLPAAATDPITCTVLIPQQFLSTSSQLDVQGAYNLFPSPTTNVAAVAAINTATRILELYPPGGTWDGSPYAMPGVSMISALNIFL